MPSTFFGMNIAASGMFAYKAGLNVTAHNIANVKTAGYSRQYIQQKAKEAISLRTTYGMMGAGVEAYDILSSRDAYYDYKYRKTNAVFGKYLTQSHYMNEVQEHFYAIDEKSGGVSNSMDLFFQKISSLTKDVSESTIRKELIEHADGMMSTIQEVANSLLQSQEELNGEIQSTVDQINALARQIASLTKQINTLEVYGARANDLRDQRANAVDELSHLVDVEVIEKEPADGQGLHQFLVFIGDGTLVDSTVYNQLQIVTRTTKDNQTDAEGLYDLRWSTGQDFNIRNANLGGQLQALFELRDGNNEENFHATLDSWSQSNDDYNGKATITLKTDGSSSVNASMLSRLNIPESDGLITIANFDYRYESFEVSIAADGTYTYTFVLAEPMEDGKEKHLQAAMKSGKTNSEIGDAIAFRGIPYYMSQLSEFVRTFSANFNQIQNGGYDLYGNKGIDMFVATSRTGTEEFDMTEFLYNNKDGFYYLNGCKVLDSQKLADFTQQGYTFTPVNGEAGYFMMLDSDGNEVEKVYQPADDQSIFTFTSYTTKGNPTSYYTMTALNATVAKAMIGDGKLLACSTSPDASLVEQGLNLERMTTLREDTSMFKQGAPGSFLAVITATIGVDQEKLLNSAKNSENILNGVDYRRLSQSGVDEDEEGQHMIEYQSLLNYQYRVLSVMNEVLDKLINGTAV